MKRAAVYSDTTLGCLELKGGQQSIRWSKGLPLCLVIITTLAGGCTAVPDRMETASLKWTVSGYPAVAIERQMPHRHKASKEALPAKVATAHYFGKAPYICTPSGFGRKAGCFLRG